MAAELISGVFKLHGAVNINPGVLVPSTAKMNLTKGTSCSQDQVRVLDDQGNLLQLPSNLTQNFARSIALTMLQSGASELRRFDVSKVLEKNPMGPKPREQYHACFDVVWDRDTAFPQSSAVVRDAVYRAETISALDEVTSSLGLLGVTSIRVSHTALLPALIDICVAQSGQSLSEDVDVTELLRVISQTKLDGKEDYRLLKRRLLSRLPDEESVFDMVDLLLTFLEIKGPIKPALALLKQMSFVQSELFDKHSTRPLLRQSIRELEELQKVLVDFRFDHDGVQDKPERSPVLLDLSYIPSTKIYEGLVFAVVSPHVQSPLAVVRSPPNTLFSHALLLPHIVALASKQFMICDNIDALLSVGRLLRAPGSDVPATTGGTASQKRRCLNCWLLHVLPCCCRWRSSTARRRRPISMVRRRPARTASGQLGTALDQRATL
jgi:hypothetical protein